MNEQLPVVRCVGSRPQLLGLASATTDLELPQGTKSSAASASSAAAAAGAGCVGGGQGATGQSLSSNDGQSQAGLRSAGVWSAGGQQQPLLQEAYAGHLGGGQTLGWNEKSNRAGKDGLPVARAPDKPVRLDSERRPWTKSAALVAPGSLNTT